MVRHTLASLSLLGVLAAGAASAADIYGLGTVEARVSSRLGFAVTGTLVELVADHGDRVETGRPLARLDAAEQQARLAQAEADLGQAEAAVRQAEARLARARAVQTQKRAANSRRQSLARSGTVSSEAAEDAQATAQVAEADVAVAASDVEAARSALAAARARLRHEAVLLDKHILAAPYGGVVVERARELGAVLAPGTTVFTLADPATVWVRAFVDESAAGGLALGQAAEIRLRSRPDAVLPGRLVRIDIENDRVSEERRVSVAFDAIPADFHLGEQAEVILKDGRK